MGNYTLCAFALICATNSSGFYICFFSSQQTYFHKYSCRRTHLQHQIHEITTCAIHSFINPSQKAVMNKLTELKTQISLVVHASPILLLLVSYMLPESSMLLSFVRVFQTIHYLPSLPISTFTADHTSSRLKIPPFSYLNLQLLQTPMRPFLLLGKERLTYLQ